MERADPVKIDRAVSQVKADSAAMAKCREESERIARRRRATLLRLSREFGVPVREVRVLTDLAFSRVIKQLQIARVEAGITEPHPRKARCE